MITNLFYIISRIGLLGLFVGAFIISFYGVAGAGAKGGIIFLMLPAGIGGIIAILLTPNLSKKSQRFSALLILLICGVTAIRQLNEDALKILEAYSYFENSRELFAKVLTSYSYFLPSLLIVFAHWNLRSLNKHVNESKVPEVLVAVFQSIIFAIPSALVISKVFSTDLTAVLATSGVLVAIFGLALQPNLSNVLSGIFVSLERPFKPNEWVTIDDKTGIVLDVNWRSTKIRTFENTEVVIPNEIVAKSTLQNWSRPDKAMMSEGFHIFNTLSFHPQHDPRFISNLLHNALSKVTPVDGRQELGLQWVKFIEVDEYGLKFAVAFDCTNRLMKNSQQNVVLTEIHQVLAHAGISMSAGRLTTHMDHDTGLSALTDVARKTTDFDPNIKDILNPYNEAVKNKALLKKVPIFSSLSEDELGSLSEDCERRSYSPKQFVCEQSRSGGSLFIVVDGVVSVDKSDESGEVTHIAKLGVGDFFGEMSLMTGEPRSASVCAVKNTVVLEIKKETIKTLFGTNKRFYDNVAFVFAKRKLKMEDLEKSESVNHKEMHDMVTKFKNAIVKFLS